MAKCKYLRPLVQFLQRWQSHIRRRCADCDDDFTVDLVGQTKNSYFPYSWMFQDMGFNFKGRELETTTLNDICTCTPQYAPVSITIDDCISGPEGDTKLRTLMLHAKRV